MTRALEVVTRETSGAFLFGYLVGVAWKLLLRKRVSGLLEGLWCPLHCSFVLVGVAAREEKEGDACLYVGGGWPPTQGSEMKRGKDVTLHLIAPPTNAWLPPLISHHALCLHPPLLSICCWRPHFLRLFHALSPACCPGTCNHCSPIPGLPPEDIWKSSQLP